MPNLDGQHLMLIQLDIAHDLLQAHDDCMSKRNLRTDSSMSYILHLQGTPQLVWDLWQLSLC